MTRAIVTKHRLKVRETQAQTLLASFRRLPILKTLSSTMEIKDIARACARRFQNKSGACAPLTRQACMAGSRPRNGLTLSLAAIHRKAIFEKRIFSQCICLGGFPDGK